MSRQWWEKDGLELGLGEGRTEERVVEEGRESGKDMEVVERRGGGVRGDMRWVNETYMDT